MQSNSKGGLTGSYTSYLLQAPMSNVGPPTVHCPTAELSDLNITLFVVIVVTIIELVGSFGSEGENHHQQGEPWHPGGHRTPSTAEGQEMPCTQTPHDMLCEETTFLDRGPLDKTGDLEMI